MICSRLCAYHSSTSQEFSPLLGSASRREQERESKKGIVKILTYTKKANLKSCKPLRTSYPKLYDDAATAITKATVAASAICNMHMKVLHSQYPHYSPRGS